MIEQAMDTIERLGLVKKNDQVMLGVSGGPDSMFLLHLFSRLQKPLKLKLVGLHFNHGLRPEADSEEEFVKKTCAGSGLHCISEKKDVKKFFHGDSMEQTARHLRYDFFLKCSRQTKIKKLALAHHKDDLIETVLMRLIRGSGLRGVRGFLPESKYKSLVVIRPLIEARKSELVGWLEDNKVKYCVDMSNFEEVYFRNRVRLKLIPLLEELNPNVVDNLASASRSIAQDYDFLYRYCRAVFDKLKRKEVRNGLYLDLKGLKELDTAVFNNVVRIAIEECKGDTRRIESRHLDELRDLILHRPVHSVVDLPGLSVTKEADKLLIQTLIL